MRTGWTTEPLIEPFVRPFVRPLVRPLVRVVVGLVATTAAVFGVAAAAGATPDGAPQAGSVVSPRIPLKARGGPAVWNPQIRAYGNGSPLALTCQTRGQRIAGTLRITEAWDRLADGTYVSDAYVRRAGALPPCTQVGRAPAAAPAVAPAAPTSTAIAGTVASARIPLKSRTGAAVWYPQVGALTEGAGLPMVCQVRGQRIAGSTRTTDRWNRLADGTYVSDAYVRRAATPPVCGPPAAPVAGAPAAATAPYWTHPLPGFHPGQGFRPRNQPSHIGVDLMAFGETPIRAAAAGQVVEVVCNIQAGASCDRPGSPTIRGCGWYVKLQHAGRVSTIYCHMVRRAPVEVGQSVAAGQVIGSVGASGNSSFPHLHFEIHTDAPPTGPENAVDPIAYLKARGVVL